MSIIITLKPDSDRDGFLAELDKAGIQYTQFQALKHIVLVPGADLAGFAFCDHPAILHAEQDRPDAFKGQEVVTLAPTTVGPWPILRHTSRDLPWKVQGFRFPWSGEFASVRDGTGVDIYLVDTGIHTSHQEFGGRAIRLDSWEPINPHGTQCASCAAGSSLGLARGAQVLVAAGLRSADGSGSGADIITALDLVLASYRSRASSNRPGVLSLSFASYGSPFASYESVIKAFWDEGMVVVAAAANDRVNTAAYDVQPGEQPGVILVGGINMADEPYNSGSHGSNYGLAIDILGGAQDIRVAGITANDAYLTGSGTSFAAPHVAGVLACMLQGYLRPTTPAQVTYILNYLQMQGTYGRFKKDPRFEPMMPNAPVIAYLDPGPGPYVAIEGLVPGVPAAPPVPEPPPVTSESHRFWRVYITENANDTAYTSVGELEFAEEAGTPMDGKDVTGSGTPLASSEATVGNGARFAFDNSYTSGTAGADNRYWSTAANAHEPCWIGYDFGVGIAKAIREVRIMADRDVYRAPMNFRIEYSDDGVTWALAWGGLTVPSPSWTPGTWHTFTKP